MRRTFLQPKGSAVGSILHRIAVVCMVVCLALFAITCSSEDDDQSTSPGQPQDDDNNDDASPGDDDDDNDDDNDDDDDVYFAEQDLFVNHVDGYSVFRIPSMIETTQGTLLAFCEGRDSIRDDGNIDLVEKRSFDNGQTWSALQVVIDFGPDTAGNPAPVVDRDTGRIWLPYCTNPAYDMNNRRVWITYSDDDGATWAESREITDMASQPDWGWNATGPGRSIQLQSGRLLVPCNHRNKSGLDSHSHVIYSDEGLTWQIGGILGPGTDESQVAQLEDGSLIINMRDLSSEHGRQIARSYDEGLTWTAATYDEALPDPGCQGSLLETPYGLMFSNPVGEVSILRHDLTVRLSGDGGETWALSKSLHAGPSAYSALSYFPDGRLGCLYENGEFPFAPYHRITLATFSLGWLEE
jgi:sialidase-1